MRPRRAGGSVGDLGRARSQPGTAIITHMFRFLQGRKMTQTPFLGFKNVDSGLQSTVFVSISSPLKK